MKNFEYSGWWWLPSNPKNKIGGTVTFANEEGIILTLIGAFVEGRNVDSTSEYPFILGKAVDGEEITLYRSFTLGLPRNSRRRHLNEWEETVTQRIYANVAFVGTHLTTAEALTFHRASVIYTHMLSWAPFDWFKGDFDRDTGERIWKLKIPESAVANTTKGTITVQYTTESPVDFRRSLTIDRKSEIIVDVPDNLPFDTWRSRFIHPLQDFLTLVTDSPNAIEKLELFSGDQVIKFSEEYILEKPIQVFYRSPSYTGEHIEYNEPLFTIDDIRDKFSDVMERWLKVSDELDSVCNLFFSVQYAAGMYAQHRFLNFVQAAEAYHRERCNNEVISKSEYKKRRQAILAAVPEEYSEWLEGKLNRFANQPSLLTRP
jgi:hypothetical protein